MLNNQLLIIGDVHGKTDKYHNIIQKHDGMSIQVGDFGFKREHEWHLKNVNSLQHKICFGNHDDYAYLNSLHSLNNFTIWPEFELMTIRGAFSIDKYLRTENIDWWANEELTWVEMQEAIDQYILNKPKIVISHDCPNIVRKKVFEIYDKSMTSNGLQAMFDEHKPLMWIFGHHHENINIVIEGTNFICLNELETITI